MLVLFWVLYLSYHSDLDDCKAKIDIYQVRKSQTELTDFFGEQNEAIILKTEGKQDSDSDEILFANDSV